MSVITILDQLKANMLSYKYFFNVQFVVVYHFFPMGILYQIMKVWNNSSIFLN